MAASCSEEPDVLHHHQIIEVEDSTGTLHGENYLSKSGLNVPFADKIFIPASYINAEEEPDLTTSDGNEDLEVISQVVGDGAVSKPPNFMYECCFCKVLFVTHVELDEHLRDLHEQEEKIKEVIKNLIDDPHIYSVEVETKVVIEDEHGAQKNAGRRGDSRFVCDHPGCRRKCMSEWGLQTHKLTHQTSTTCQHCGLSYKTVRNLIRHIEHKHQHHNKLKHQMVCLYNLCNKVFDSPIALHDHQVNHRDGRKCSICGTDVKNIRRHMQNMHNPRDASLLDCDICGEMMTRDALQRHKLETGGCTGKDGLTCPHPGCGRRFSSRAACFSHQRVHKRQGRTLLDPSHNSVLEGNTEMTAVTEKEVFDLPKQAEYNDQRSDEEGPLCGDVEQLLPVDPVVIAPSEDFDPETEHLDAETKDLDPDAEDLDPETSNGETKQSPEEFVCPHEHCVLSFESQDKLDWHLQFTLHSAEEMPFNCPYKGCTHSCKTAPELKEHTRKEHYGTINHRLKADKPAKSSKVTPKQKPSGNIRRRKCPMCFENFANAAKLKSHLKTMHGGNAGNTGGDMTEEPTDKLTAGPSEDTESYENNDKLVFDMQMFKCPLCHATYHSSAALRYHLEHHHIGTDSVLDYLADLEIDSSRFLDTVPATLYGDSFKGRKGGRKKRTKCEPASKKASKKTKMTNKKKNNPTVLSNGENEDDRSNSRKGKKSATSKTQTCSELEKGENSMAENKTDVEEEEGEEEEKGSHSENEPKESELNNCDKDKTSEPDSESVDNKKLNGLICRYPGCNAVHKSRFELMCHQRTHERLLKCPNEGCDHEFFNTNNLRLHIQMVHADLDITCKDCGLKGKRSFIIYRHAKHCTKKKTHVCDKCGKHFHKVSSLVNHSKVHLAKETKKKYACTHSGCSKCFKTSQDLKRHLNVHTGARPHKCPYAGCEKTYKQRPHLLVHLKAAHTLRTETNTKTYTCEFCHAQFKHSCGRTKHIRKTCLEGPNKNAILARRKAMRRKQGKGKKREIVSSDSDFDDI